MELVKKTAGEKPLVSLAPYKKRKVGIVTTGNEVFYGRIKDTFTPVIIEKMKSYGAEIHGHILCNDDMEKITAAIMKLKEEGADLIVCTGGMSVDQMIRHRARSKIQERESYLMVLRYFRERCSCYPIWKMAHR